MNWQNIHLKSFCITPMTLERSSQQAYRSFFVSSSGCERSGIITGLQPAAWAERMPFGESSRAMHSLGSSPKLLCGGEINIRGGLAVFYHVSADKLVKSVNDIYRAEIQRGAL